MTEARATNEQVQQKLDEKTGKIEIVFLKLTFSLSLSLSLFLFLIRRVIKAKGREGVDIVSILDTCCNTYLICIVWIVSLYVFVPL